MTWRKSRTARLPPYRKSRDCFVTSGACNDDRVSARERVSRPRTAGSLSFDTRFLHDLRPLRHLGLDEPSELRATERSGFSALAFELLLDIRAAEDRSHLRLQTFDDRRRCLGRREETPPVARVIAGHAGFGNRRYVRIDLRAFRSADTEKLQALRVDVRDHLNQRPKTDLRVAGDHIGHRGAAALERDMHDVDPGHDPEKLA